MWWLARPLAAAGVSPDVVTVGSAAAAVAATAAPPGRRWPLLVAGSVLDGVDGAVAVLTDRQSSYGARLDHTADRVADVSAAVVLTRAGAPWAVVAPGLALTFALELTRRTPVVTVAERPTRVVCGALGDAASAVTGRRWPAVVAAVVWDALAAVALVQLVRARRR
ncbi:CDP-alcohol phosphatidyltransferase family protein [Jatrophihabitans sp. YIM 134969]